MEGLIGKKIGMTQVYDADGNRTCVTVIECGPCPVVQLKTLEKDGYAAAQVGFGPQKAKRLAKAQQKHFEKAGVEAMKVLKEFALDEGEALEVGKAVTVANFEGVKYVDVTGVTKGKGFAGVIKRHGFGGGPGGHGSHFHRAPGSIGQCATPSRVLKGVRLPGHMGCDRVTVKNLEVVRIDEDLNLILVKGAVPGGKNGIVIVRKSLKNNVIAAKAAKKGAK